jgi:hypothetical protein
MDVCLIYSNYVVAALTPAFALSGSLLITLILPQITRHEIFASEVIVVQEKAGGSSRGRSKTKLLTELELGICGAAIISLSVLGMSWMGIIVSLECYLLELEKLTVSFSCFCHRVQHHCTFTTMSFIRLPRSS